MRQGVFTPKLKLLWHREHIDKFMRNEPFYPVMVEMDLTNRCTLKCNFCTFDYIQDKSDIDTESALRAISAFGALGVKSINFTGGGEPTLHKDFLKIVEHANRCGIRIGLFTNGMHITEDMSHKLVGLCDWIRVSIDAGTEETFKAIKGTFGLSRVKESVRKLVQTKSRQNIKTTIGIGFVITHKNYTEIEKFSQLNLDLHADYVQYKPEIKNCFQTKISESKWWDTEVRPRLEKVMVSNDKAVINLYKFNDLVSDIDREYSVCYGHSFVPCIGATGDVWVCTHLRNISGYSYGNIKDTSFKEIWDSQKRQDVIKTIDLNKCQSYCRNNEINKVLWALKENKQEGHYDFI